MSDRSDTRRPEGLAGLPPRVLLATQPKAGTYLLSAVVAELGFHQTYFHIARRRMQAYDRTMLEAGAASPRNFDVEIPLRQSLKLIRHGEFAASHLTPRREVLRLVGHDFAVIACVRELRSSLISYARFAASTGRKGEATARKIREEGAAPFIRKFGKRLIDRAQSIAAWGQQENAILLQFEDLKTDPQKGAGRIADFLGVTDRDPAEVLETARSGQSLTKSDSFVSLEWTEAEEAAFRHIGGPEANAALGYPAQGR